MIKIKYILLISILFLSILAEDQQKSKNAQDKKDSKVVKKDKSDMVLFLSSSGRENYLFLRNFKEYYDKLKDSINLQLVYHTYKCEYCDDSECVLVGQFCSLDSDTWEYGTGAYIVNEQFRQYNLFELLKKQNKIDVWFDYMNKFDENCDVDWRNSKVCSEKIAKELGVTQNLGLGDQFGTMSEWRRIQASSKIYSFPDVTINGQKYKEFHLQPLAVFQTVCESLKTPPDTCTGEQGIPNTSKTGVIVGLVIGSMVLFLLGVYCYKTMIKRELTNDMSSKVGELVARYSTKVSEQSKKRREKVMQRMTQQL